MLHAYRYAAPSSWEDACKPRLTLATAENAGVHPHFFEGAIRQPRLVANLLGAVHLLVGSRFFTPANSVAKAVALADPVVTSGGGLLRFEGLSSCCSAYVRADLLPGSYDGQITGTGTTNVDFNEPMRAALARVRDDAGLELAVGREEFRLRSAGADVIERKVDLPTRWLRGLLEVQSYQARMEKRLETSGVSALKFFRTLPKSSTHRTPLWIAAGHAGWFSTSRAVDGAVRVSDPSRLRVLHALAPHARTLSVFADDAHQANAWVLDFGTARLTLTLSAEVWRGFSGEGQALRALMQAGSGDAGAALARVRARLNWEAALESAVLARELGTSCATVDDALLVLGASGMAGFDVFAGHYFHRVLPFDLSMVEDLHPRLADARALIDAGAIKILKSSPYEASVSSGDAAHHVREVDGDLRCTCPWFAKHQGERGPCKHVLAAAALRTADTFAA